MPGHRPSTPHRLARLLGWASLGLGASLTTAPGAVCRLAGLDDSSTARRVTPIVGGRELLHAGLLLGSRRPARWAWTRVAGDAMDLALLGGALATRTGARRRRAALATAVVAGITAADVTAAIGARDERERGEQEMRLEASVTVRRPREEVYRFWHDFANLPRFMAHLQSVEVSDGRSHWTARGPARTSVEWDAELAEDRPEELIAWRSTSSARVPNSGSVRFRDAPEGRGTEIHVELDYRPPGGRAASAAARLLGEHPEQQVRDDLRRLKQVLETGEVVRSEGSPQGALALGQARQRPAQPLAGG